MRRQRVIDKYRALAASHGGSALDFLRLGIDGAAHEEACEAAHYALLALGYEDLGSQTMTVVIGGTVETYPGGKA